MRSFSLASVRGRVARPHVTLVRRCASVPRGVLGLAQAKREAPDSSSRAAVPWLVAAGAALALAFFDGLWAPLLRDAQSPLEAKAPEKGPPRLRPGAAAQALGHLLRGSVVVVDGFLSSEELAAARDDAKELAARGGLRPNPKAQAGNVGVRTDRVAYVRDGEHFGPALLHCHRALRGLAWELEEASQEALQHGAPRLVQQWTQLAVYDGGGGFYAWHSDGLAIPIHFWLLLPVGVFLFLKWGAVRRRQFTAILYLNDEVWPCERGGSLRCRAPAVLLGARGEGPQEEAEIPTNGIVEVVPHGGRLVLFSSQAVEHEVSATQHERWALTLWMHR